MKTMHRALLRYFLPLVITLGVSGCYLPVRFDAEVEISRQGYYEFFFDGYIARVELFDGLNKGEISREEEKEQMELLKTDFERDSSTKSFKYIKRGHFHVNWQKKGDLVKVKTVTFYRRNENMVSISYNSTTGRVQVAGRSLSRKQRRTLHDMGLGMTGELRVITDTNVIAHNATSVKQLPKRGARYKMYTWEIKNIFDKTPSITMALR
ncbi:MAG: hypothetical protein HQ483_10625 [Rhodospirillales bacterium]|nr:hypothetical protein [Rhodospirillales bacterium]